LAFVNHFVRPDVLSEQGNKLAKNPHF